MSNISKEARAYLAMLPSHIAERKAAKLIKRLADDNARLEKMLELAARDRIGFSEWGDKYGPFGCGKSYQE